MCKRYICTQSLATIERRFNLDTSVPNSYKASYNISKGNLAPVITNEHPKHLQFFRFGMTPFWSENQMGIINARVEGERNKTNDPNYTGAKAIINMRAFQKPIRSQRCLVIADAFIVGTEKTAQPHVVHLKNRVRPFAFAGLWDVWKDNNGYEQYSFAIITITANRLLRRIGQERAPVILPRNRELAWLNNNLPLFDAIRYLQPLRSDLMGTYPIADTIKDPDAEGRHLIEPHKQAEKKENLEKTSVDFGLYGGWCFKMN